MDRSSAASSGPIREIDALSPEPASLAQPAQAPLRLLLLKEGVDRLADQGALAAAAAQGQDLQSLPFRLRKVDLGAQHRAGRRR